MFKTQAGLYIFFENAWADGEDGEIQGWVWMSEACEIDKRGGFEKKKTSWIVGENMVQDEAVVCIRVNALTQMLFRIHVAVLMAVLLTGGHLKPPVASSSAR